MVSIGERYGEGYSVGGMNIVGMGNLRSHSSPLHTL